MAKRRTLKKSINGITSTLFAEGVFIKLTLAEAERGKADEILADILHMQDEFVCRINHTEPGNVKGFYKKLYEDFNAAVDSILDKMSALKG